MTPYYDKDGITIYLGDCREVLPTLEVADLVIADPPYSVSIESGKEGNTASGLSKANKDFFACDRDWAACRNMIRESMSALRLAAKASVYCWCGHRQISHLADDFEGKGWSTRLLGWSKPCPAPPMPGSGWPSALELCLYAYRPGRTWAYTGIKPPPSNVIVSDALRNGQLGKTRHPTQKPLRTIVPLIAASSREGETVLDPFMGSGTTLRAAKDLGRKAIGIEIHEPYAEIAARRMEQGVLNFEPAS